MKLRSIITWCALLCGSALFAQQIHPANPSGKPLTLEEAVLGRGVTPQRPSPDIYERPSGRPDLEALSQGGSLFIRKGTDTLCIARSQGPGHVYGETVSRNEFGIDGGIFWSPDSSRLAYYYKDESRVTLFPLLDIKTRTGSLMEIRYPMNGMASEIIRLGIYDMESGKTVFVNCNDFTEERYLTNVSWSPDSRDVYIQVLDRSQHHMRLNRYSASTGEFVRTLLTEDNEAWVEPQNPIRFLKDRSDLFIYTTDNRDGWQNLYLCDTLGGIRRITAVDADVNYIANDGKYLWYTSTEVSPIENHLFRMKINIPNKKALTKAKFGKPSRLTPEKGWHTILMTEDCSGYIDSWSELNTPRVVCRKNPDGSLIEEILRAPDPLEGRYCATVELGTVPSADGQYENYYRLIKPADFDPSKKYPLILYVYGGPHSQLVRDEWLGSIRMWEMYMAQKGYVVYVQDNRGTSNRGAAFEKAINRQCGRAEMEDQMVGIRTLMAEPWIDSERIGVHGWSYGGFMTISLMTNYPDVFKVGVAGGPVIDWKWYEIMYGERYMDNPATNPEGFAATSLIGKADRLKGRLLICQGAIDNTVVWEHSLSFIDECIRKRIRVDYFPYPTHEHNVRGKDRVHLMDKVTLYFDDFLK